MVILIVDQKNSKRYHRLYQNGQHTCKFPFLFNFYNINNNNTIDCLSNIRTYNNIYSIFEILIIYNVCYFCRDLHNNTIKNLTDVNWGTLSNLTVLNLNKNYISYIPKDSFINQTDLKIL